MGILQGKIALITGGNSGIGLATAKAFVREGAQVVIVGRNKKTLKEAEIELGSNSVALQADISISSELDSLFIKVREKFGRIDVLFVNAGIAKIKPVEQVTEEIFDTIFNTNTRGLFFTVQKAIPLLSNGASVILISSAVVDKGIPGGSVYAASKAAVRSLARSFSAELVGLGVRVNVISPGPIETPIFDRMGLSDKEQKTMSESLKERVPLNRFGNPEEIPCFSPQTIQASCWALRYPSMAGLVSSNHLSKVDLTNHISYLCINALKC